MPTPVTKKKQQPKKSNLSAREYLNQTPLEQDVRQHGDGLHIPILNLENALDFFRWGTRNFVWQLYKNGYAKLGVGASLELLLSYTDENGEKVVDRPFIGACNFLLESIDPIEDWLATAKSLCIKNAASDAGKKLGRGLNDNVVPERKSDGDIAPKLVAPKRKMKPDQIILNQLNAAKAAGDKAAIAIIENIYEIKPEDNGNKTI